MDLDQLLHLEPTHLLLLLPLVLETSLSSAYWPANWRAP
jgi:hypothetical protein